MAFLDGLKNYFHRRALNKAQEQNKLIKRSFIGKENVKSISILYSDTGPFDKKEIKKFAERQKRKGLEVNELLFSKEKKLESENDCFNKDQLGFNRIPKGEIIEKFNALEGDLFYNLLDPDIQFAGYMSLVNKSRFRIGLSTDQSVGCDLMIKMNDRKLKPFLETADHILSKMDKKESNAEII